MRRCSSILACVIAASCAICAASAVLAAAQPSGPAPLLEVLCETGKTRGDLPVDGPHPDASRYAAALQHGLSGRLLRLYAMEQRYLQARKGIEPEPAYLLVSGHQGGFPRFGFYLGAQPKPGAGYVDLPGRQRIGGLFGAMDQIFPHELGHVILAQLAGLPRHGGSNQIHAIGVRTDPFNAFNEGFAEHFQVMAVDDPEALPETRALLRDRFFERRASMQLAEYTWEIEARWPAAGRRRIAFPVWYSATEQALRYYGVKANAFARQPRIAARLLHADPYSAYLLENVLPGQASDPPKSPAQLASTEGVVAALFVRWVTDPRMQNVRREPAFYLPFGVAADRVTPLENAYLKLFHALFVSHPADVREAIAGYKATFPDEAATVDDIVGVVSMGRSFESPPAIWLANDQFRIGTSLFDQFRTQLRIHTFDLNAASTVDLVAVPGVRQVIADAIRRRVPFASLDELQHVKGVDAALMQRFQSLLARATAMRDNPANEESSLSLATILGPYVLRAALLILVAGLLGGAAYRLAVPRGWPRAILNGIAAAMVGFLPEVALDLPVGIAAMVAAPLLLGVPAALYCLAFPGRTARQVARRRPRPPARRTLALAVLFAWALAALPLVLLMTPHF